MAKDLVFEIEQNGLGDALGGIAKDAIDSNMSVVDDFAQKLYHDDIEADQGKVDQLSSLIKSGASDLVGSLSDKLSSVTVDTGSALGDSMANIGIEAGVGALDSLSSLTSNPLGALANPSSAISAVESFSKDMVNSATDMVTSMVKSLLSSADLSSVLKGLDVTNEVISTAKQVLEAVKLAGTVKSNIERLASIISTIDPQTHTFPSAKGSTKRLSASLKTQVTCAYLDAKQQVVDMGNSMIVSSNDAVIDNVTASIDSILEKVDPLIGEYMEEYCGISIPEVRSTCSEGFLKINQIKRVAKKSKTAIEDRKKKAEKNEKDKEKTKKAAKENKKKAREKESEKVTKLKEGVDAKLKAYKEKAVNLGGTAKANAEAQIKQLEDKSKMYEEQLVSFGKGVAADASAFGHGLAADASAFGNSFVADSSAWAHGIADDYSEAALNQLESWKSDYDPSTMKAELLDWLNDLSIILQNAFHILTIKDLIDEIKEKIQTILKTGIDNLEDFVDVMTAITEIFKMLNITEDAEGLKIEDFQAVIDELATLGPTIIDNIISTAKDAALSTADLITNDMKNIAFDTFAGASSLAGSAVASTLDIYDQTKQSAVSTYEETKTAGISAYESAVAEGTEAYQKTMSQGLSAYEDLASNTTGYILSQADAATALVDTAKSMNKENAEQTISNIAQQTNILFSLNNPTETLNSISSVASGKADEVVDKVGSLASDTLNNANNIASEASSKLTNMTDKGLESAMNMGSNVMGAATDTASKAANSLMNSAGDMADQAKSLVDNINSTAIATAKQMAELPKLLSKKVMNSILENFQLKSIDSIMNKCVIFDPILKMIQTVLPILDIVKTLIELVNNYKTNKKHVQDISLQALSDKAKQLYENALGLLGKFGLDLTNFYTVRTKSTYDWITLNLQFETESANTLKLDTALTNRLRIYLAVLKIDHQSLKAMLPSILYIDYEGIEAGDKEDGTTNGLDNVIIDEENQMVYYDPEGRHTTSSEILRYVYTENPPGSSDDETDKITTDVIAESDLTEDEKFSKLMDLITFSSDEIDGQQTIVMDDLYLCIQDETVLTPVLKDDSDIKEDRTIIEFGSEWTKGKEVEYVLNVKPGQKIDDKTILAYIKRGDNLTPLRSVFGSGTVKATKDGSDYWHVFAPCKKHIVLENCEPGIGSDYDPADISTLANKMNESGLLASLIMNAMPYCALPEILTHRTPGLIPTSVKTYESYIKKYEETINKYKDIFLNEGGEAGIRATGGNPAKMQALQNKMLEYRKQMMDEVISSYLDELPKYSCIGSLSYSDCACLAYGSASNSPNSIFQIGNNNYANYYMGLLSNIDISNDSIWAKKYYNVLQDIITTRVQTETYSLNSLIREFNSLVNANVSDIDDPYSLIANQFKDSEPKYDEVNKRIRHMLIYSHASAQDKANFANLDTKEQDSWYTSQETALLLSKSAENLSGLAKQLTNIFLYIKTESPKLRTETSSHVSIEQLTLIYNNSFRDLILNVNDPYTISKNKYVLICADDDITEKRLSFKQWLQALLPSLDNETYERMTNLFLSIFTENTEVDRDILNFVQNNQAYQLVKNEAAVLKQFWTEAITAFRTEYDLNTIIDEFKSYGESLAQYEPWTAPTTIYVRGKNYSHYLFYDVSTGEKQSIADLEIPAPTEAPTEIPKPVIDASAMATAIKELTDHETTMFDYEYWLVYFVNATLLTLLPAFWADGFDIPPAMTPLKLPGIYLPIMKPIYIQPLKVLLVLGIGLRGIWPAPIVLTVNLSSNDINAMLPIQITTELLLKAHNILIEYAENTIPNIVKGLVNGFIEENALLLKSVLNFKTYASLIKSIPIPDKALIEKEFREALHGLIDRRQVVTRTDELAKGDGPGPM